MSVKQIIEGHSNEVTKKNQNLYDERMPICEKCPLYKKTFLKNYFGPICNSNLYLNPETNKVSYLEKEGTFNGCGCRLEAKVRVQDAKCPAGKW
jgi:hypothetical protein